MMYIHEEHEEHEWLQEIQIYNSSGPPSAYIFRPYATYWLFSLCSTMERVHPNGRDDEKKLCHNPFHHLCISNESKILTW